MHSQRGKGGLKCCVHLEISCLAVICFSSPALFLSWQRPTPGGWVPFIYYERDRPREKLLLPATGPFKPVQETGKSASYFLCSHTLLPGLQLRGRGSKHCSQQSRQSRGLNKYQGKPPSHHVLNPGLQEITRAPVVLPHTVGY